MPTIRDSVQALHLGGLALASIADDPRLGTPTYVYDLDAMAGEARELHRAFDGARHAIAYALKANSAGPRRANARA